MKYCLGKKGMGPIDIIYFAIIVVVGASIFASFSTTATQITSGSTTSAQAVVANVSANTWAGFQTISSAPVIMAAVVILGIVGLLMLKR